MQIREVVEDGAQLSNKADITLIGLLATRARYYLPISNPEV